MATIKSFTSLEQSKKLEEILPIESADMYYHKNTKGDFVEYPHFNEEYKSMVDRDINYNDEVIPCWSLASLLEQLPYELCDDDGNSAYLQINKEDDVYQLAYEDYCLYRGFESIETDRYAYFVDACYEMVLKLHELNML